MRILGAVRLSLKTDETTSSGRQREQITRMARARGDALVAIAEDLDVSGSVSPFERDDLGPWLTDPAKIRSWDVLMVAKLDRLTRSLPDFMELLTWCKDHGKTIVSVAESLDFSTAVGRMFAQLLAMFAEFERARIGERRAEAAVKLRSEARWGGGRVPYGYMVEGNGHGYVLVANPPEQAVIERAARMVIDGATVTGVCAMFNAEGIASQSGKPWRSAVMLRMLRNPVIRGYVVADGQIVRDGDGLPVRRQGLVDDDTWLALQAALDRNASPGSGVRTDSSLLLQVGFCAHCGQPLYGQAKKGRGYSYYTCKTRRTGGTCQSKAIRSSILDDRVSEALVAAVGTVPMRKRVVVPAEDHEVELAKVTESIEALKQPYLAGKISADIFADMIGRLEARQIVLRQLPTREETIRWTQTGQTFAEHWDSLSKAERHSFLLASNVRAYVGGIVAEPVPMTAAALSDRRLNLGIIAGQIVTVDLGSLAELRDMAATG